MLKEVNLYEQLQKERNKTIDDNNILRWVENIFNDLGKEREATLIKLQNYAEKPENQFDIDSIDADCIFHIDQIRKICIDYRLRFLPTKYFKGEYPEEVISKIHNLEKIHNTTLANFKIIAPSKLFVLKKADDPVLFAPMGNGFYYLIHKWGKDLHPLRKYKMWSLKNVGNLGFTTFTACILLTILSTNFIFNGNAKPVYHLMLFLFYFKFAIGFILFYGIASGKNFSEYMWRSKYNKVQ